MTSTTLRRALPAALVPVLLLSGCALPFGAGAGTAGPTDSGSAAPSRPAPSVTPLAVPGPPAPVDYAGMEYTVTQVVLHAPFAVGDAVTGSTAVPAPFPSGEQPGVLVRFKVRNTTETWQLSLAQIGLTKGGDSVEAQIRPSRGDEVVQSGTTVEAYAYLDTVDPASLDGWTLDVHESGTVPAVFPAAGAPAATPAYPVPATVGPVGKVLTGNGGGGATVTVTDAAYGLDGLPAYGGRARTGTRFLNLRLRVAHRQVPTYYATGVYFTFRQDLRAVVDGVSVPMKRCEDAANGQENSTLLQVGATAEVVCAVEVPVGAATVAVSAGDPGRGRAAVRTAPVTSPALPPVDSEAPAASGSASPTAAA
ncbi:hypothetical protein [Kineosporia sp. A_224]|uniref:hypothetical protein n=1 Tax=Kineosporia sp. A_224 TaxID=1962180 RepID=UPI000B4B4091|nr:hypothetical protein [Kineosporia sp. A_224]